MYYQTYYNRTTAIHYARETDIQFGSPIDRGKRATLKTVEHIFTNKAEPLKLENYGKLV